MTKIINILSFINVIFFLEDKPFISLIFIIFLIGFNREVLKDGFR